MGASVWFFFNFKSTFSCLIVTVLSFLLIPVQLNIPEHTNKSTKAELIEPVQMKITDIAIIIAVGVSMMFLILFIVVYVIYRFCCKTNVNDQTPIVKYTKTKRPLNKYRSFQEKVCDADNRFKTVKPDTSDKTVYEFAGLGISNYFEVVNPNFKRSKGMNE
ncbi:hypothetical protein A3Q56_01297 [Intoshia linei]|uniref:Uncharacterized protein n=1 Tax=Intoshia linei TaxID=1819745 RepID=A0A177B9C9_9BILA|nr:hypothetical protein A3Q56_01297 [Intoshia linei]